MKNSKVLTNYFGIPMENSFLSKELKVLAINHIFKNLTFLGKRDNVISSITWKQVAKRLNHLPKVIYAPIQSSLVY